MKTTNYNFRYIRHILIFSFIILHLSGCGSLNNENVNSSASYETYKWYTKSSQFKNIDYSIQIDGVWGDWHWEIGKYAITQDNSIFIYHGQTHPSNYSMKIFIFESSLRPGNRCLEGRAQIYYYVNDRYLSLKDQFLGEGLLSPVDPFWSKYPMKKIINDNCTIKILNNNTINLWVDDIGIALNFKSSLLW